MSSLHDVLASMRGKTIISVLPTVDEDDELSELQFQFADGSHLIVKGWGAGWEVDTAGVEITTDLNRTWWAS